MIADSPFFGLLRPVNKCLEIAIFEKCWSAREDAENPVERFERLTSRHIMMDLKNNELNLDGGRFRFFSKFEKYSREVVLDVRPYNPKFIEKINWIDEYVNHKWSMTVLPEEGTITPTNFETFAVYCIFHFENKIDAGYFALRWR